MNSRFLLAVLCLTAVLGCSATDYRTERTDDTATGTPYEQSKVSALARHDSDDSLIVQDILVGKLPPRTFVLKAAGLENQSIGTMRGGMFTLAIGQAVEEGQASDSDGDGRISLREIKSYIDEDYYPKHLDEARLKASFAIASIPDVVLFSENPIPPSQKPRRKLVALLVGVGRHQDSRWDLPGIDLDIQTLSAVLNSDNLLASDSTIRVLLNEEATYGNVIDALDWLAETTAKEDLAVIYFSGHSNTLPSTRSVSTLFLVLHDAKIVDEKPQGTLETSVLLKKLGAVQAAARIVLIDS